MAMVPKQASVTPPDFDVRDLINGLGLLAGTANVVMQLALPAVGYGVLESEVGSGQVMRYPLKRLRSTVTYLSVALMGTTVEREIYRRKVNRPHASVRSTTGSPVSYNALDPKLQLWVAACLYRGVIDVHTLLHGPVDDVTADAIYYECSRLGTTLQVPEEMWPVDRDTFERYWVSALAEIRIDPPVREYLYRLMMLKFLPKSFSTAFGPFNRFLTAGFLSPPFREQMRLHWSEHDEQQFRFVMRAIASINHLLPSPISQFPFNVCLQDLRVQITLNHKYGGPAPW
jgi:uncharacterized protein (DUF2236 family)